MPCVRDLCLLLLLLILFEVHSRGFKGSENVSLDLFELEDEDQETENYDYPGEDSDLEPDEPESIALPSQPDVLAFSRGSGESKFHDGMYGVFTSRTTRGFH